jgi:hypothetical protein
MTVLHSATAFDSLSIPRESPLVDNAPATARLRENPHLTGTSAHIGDRKKFLKK